MTRMKSRCNDISKHALQLSPGMKCKWKIGTFSPALDPLGSYTLILEMSDRMKHFERQMKMYLGQMF